MTPRRRHRSAALAGMVLAAVLGTAGLAVAGPVPEAGGDGAAAVDEYALKAAFLFNFTRFVEWPPGSFGAPDAPFRVCVLGTDPFGERLDPLRERQAAGRPIAIERPADLAALSRCQIAYLGDGVPADLVAATRDGRLPGVLGVSSDPAFAREGGMVALVTQGDRVRLHVNLDAIRASPLRFSANLLEIAQVRHGTSAPSGSGGSR
ncbi:MAG: YfiR family protein [Lysobacteraceae bacterium]|jgi:hypothetical protein|nr:YfiR family protein [Xanthomonadaceae bacterium]MCZ8319511.1 YfiR family protein [Silanimonas sp.]